MRHHALLSSSQFTLASPRPCSSSSSPPRSFLPLPPHLWPRSARRQRRQELPSSPARRLSSARAALARVSRRPCAPLRWTPRDPTPHLSLGSLKSICDSTPWPPSPTNLTHGLRFELLRLRLCVGEVARPPERVPCEQSRCTKTRHGGERYCSSLNT